MGQWAFSTKGTTVMSLSTVAVPARKVPQCFRRALTPTLPLLGRLGWRQVLLRLRRLLLLSLHTARLLRARTQHRSLARGPGVVTRGIRGMRGWMNAAGSRGTAVVGTRPGLVAWRTRARGLGGVWWGLDARRRRLAIDTFDVVKVSHAAGHGVEVGSAARLRPRPGVCARAYDLLDR